MMSARSAMTPRKRYTTTMKISTSSMPTTPAMRPARSESAPSVAEICCFSMAVSVTGRAPVLSTRARSLASWVVKLPVISALPPEMPCGFSR